MLSNREVASLCWLGVIVVGVIVLLIVTRGRGKIGSSILALVKAALSPKIVVMFLGFIIWVMFAVALSWRAGWWDISLLKDSVIITLGVGFPLVYLSASAKTFGVLVRKVLREGLGFGALTAAYLSLESLPLVGEIILQPFIVLLFTLWSVASLERRYRPAYRIFTVVVLLTAVGVLAWTTAGVIAHLGQTDWGAVLRSFVLGIWLPAFMLPYVYFSAVVAGLEVAMVHLTLKSSPPFRVKLAMVIGLRFRLKLIARYTGIYAMKLGKISAWREARAHMAAFREDVDEEDERVRERDAHEAALVGVEGVDHEGAQLDRREFDVTKKRLESVWMSQIGRYPKNGNRYADDLTDLAVHAERFGLPSNHGFVTEVTGDDQRWRSWRRLPNGWVLAIGGERGEIQKYHFSGAEPPAEWPGADSQQWVNELDGWPVDWRKYDGPLR